MEDDNPENITLPPPTDDSIREACTIRANDEIEMLKPKTDIDNEDQSIFVMPESDEQNEVDGHNMDAIADVVKATLANQTGG